MGDRKHVRITCDDGWARSMSVVDVVTGEEIPLVQAVTFVADVTGDPLVHAEVRTILPRVDVKADAVVRGACPYCGHEPDPE